MQKAKIKATSKKKDKPKKQNRAKVVVSAKKVSKKPKK